MEIVVDFGKAKEGVEFDSDISDGLSPMLSAYVANPKLGDAVMDFIAELLECDKTCECSSDSADVKCMTAVGARRGLVLIANIATAAVPFRLDCTGMKVGTVRLIDSGHADVRVPMPESLSCT